MRKKNMAEEILTNATMLFWSEGFVNVSIKDIAEASGCTRGNIYNHFESKEDILYQAFLKRMNELINVLIPLKEDNNTDPVEQLEDFIERHLIHVLTPLKGKLLDFDSEIRHLSPVHAIEIIKLRDTYDTILRKILARGREKGLFRKTNYNLVNYAISSTIMRTKVWYKPEGKLSIKEIAGEVSDIFCKGLLSRN